MTDAQQILHTTVPDAFEAVLEPAAAISAVLVVYLIIAMAMGCPYCGMPDMKWPATILKGVLSDS